MRDDLGNRMKDNYENRAKTYLTRRTPVIIRLDGKAFHTFTRGFAKPFDDVLSRTMIRTMKYLCENIQGCVLGYTQSDEITLVLVDYKNLNSSAWFDYNIQKVCSIAASAATLAFNRIFVSEHEEWYNSEQRDEKVAGAHIVSMRRGALFDARCFNIPKEEVANCLLWRQQDATRNSIQSVAQANFSHKVLQGLNTTQLQELLFSEKGINWNDLPTHLRRGACCKRNNYDGNSSEVWEIDLDIPKFTEDRKYINDLIGYNEDANT